MPTYEVLVSDALLPEFTGDGARLPEGFRIVGPAEGSSGYRSSRFRVEDESAPEWTEGRLIDPTFTNVYDDDGAAVVAVRVTGWNLLDEAVVRTAAAVQEAEDNPGRTVTVDGTE
jgi:hypothetical protein